MTIHKRRTFVIDDCSYDTIGRIGDPCVYCGQESTGHDHIPPLVHVNSLDEKARNMLNLRKYPACIECNSILGKTLLASVPERRKYVLGKLRSKYASCLRMPTWDEEELDELGRNLQDDVRAKSSFGNHLRQRLAYYK